jgi:hypothetical protein
MEKLYLSTCVFIFFPYNVCPKKLRYDEYLAITLGKRAKTHVGVNVTFPLLLSNFI